MCNSKYGYINYNILLKTTFVYEYQTQTNTHTKYLTPIKP